MTDWEYFEESLIACAICGDECEADQLHEVDDNDMIKSVCEDCLINFED